MSCTAGSRFTRETEENHSMVSRYVFMVIFALGMLILCQNMLLANAA